MDNLINTIINARKRQKQRIEQVEMEKMGVLETMQQQAEPVIQAMDTQTQQLSQLMQQQHAPGAAASTARAIQALPGPETAAEETASTAKEGWIQRMLRQSLGNKLGKYPYEVNLDTGKLGKEGIVNLPKLFQESAIHISKKKELIYQNDNPSLGLAALLILNLPSIEKSKIKLTHEDIDEYIQIMKEVGYSIVGTNKKYQRYFKRKRRQLPDDQEEEDAAEAVKTGSGVFAYKDAVQLEQRFRLLAGSFMAGNRSSTIKDEMRAILDELFHLGKMIPAEHQRFYSAFNL